jgi:hypothetical protein
VSIRGGAVTSRGATIVSAKPHDSRLMPVWPATISRQQAALRHSLRCIAPTDLFPLHPRRPSILGNVESLTSSTPQITLSATKQRMIKIGQETDRCVSKHRFEETTQKRVWGVSAEFTTLDQGLPIQVADRTQ